MASKKGERPVYLDRKASPKSDAYYRRKSPVTGTIELGERVATTPRSKEKGGIKERGESSRSPYSAKNVKKRMLDPRKPP